MSDLPKLVEGEDYYIENGYYVFTAHYLLKRGYCCGSGCRHCPYKNSQTAVVNDE
jgi:Family of unknown function (DUF5522)